MPGLNRARLQQKHCFIASGLVRVGGVFCPPPLYLHTEHGTALPFSCMSQTGHAIPKWKHNIPTLFLLKIHLIIRRAEKTGCLLFAEIPHPVCTLSPQSFKLVDRSVLGSFPRMRILEAIYWIPESMCRLPSPPLKKTNCLQRYASVPVTFDTNASPAECRLTTVQKLGNPMFLLSSCSELFLNSWNVKSSGKRIR